jgi:tetratricopeptide (TPR) repeat protein
MSGAGDDDSGEQVDVLVLGPVAVRVSDEVHEPSGLPAAVLGALALAGPEGLPDSDVVAATWSERAHDVSRSMFGVAVHRTRRWLAETAGDRLRIDRRATGYVLVGGRVDAHRFLHACAEAADVPDERRAGLLADALRLWRGTPLTGIEPRGPVSVLVQRLVRAQRDAVIDYGRVSIRLGRPAAAAEALLPVAEREPLDEVVHAVLIEALAAEGRRTEALHRYDLVRRRLADELGVDPGPLLGETFLRVVRAESDPPATATSIVPAQLPPDVTGFTGRSTELSDMDRAVADRVANGSAIVVITGIGGVGKTALAVHWAHRAAPGFPDGQLYADLRGYGDRRPVPPLVALGRFLRALGVPGREIPDDTDEAAALYRSVLAHRRAIVVLDNAAGTDQVRPLLPGAGGSVALITGRRRFDGLVVREAARRIALDGLAPAESLRLLASAGDGRIGADRAAAAELAALCGHLPLALRIAAADLAAQPHRTVATHVTALRGDRLTGLAIDDDPDLSVRATFALSYQRLTNADRRLFRLLSVVPGADVDTAAVAVLTGTADVADGLARLVDAQLLRRQDGRFSFHDLIGEYARERARDDEDPTVTAAARTRLFGWYAATALVANNILHKAAIRMPVPADAPAGMPLADADAARRWLEAEFANLCAVVQDAAEHGPYEIAWWLADTLDGYCYFNGLATERRTNNELAMQAAAKADDRLGTAAATLNLAHSTSMSHGATADQTVDLYTAAATAAHDSGWVDGELHALDGLASVFTFGGRPAEAVELFDRVIERSRESGLVVNEILAIGNLGVTYEVLGRLDAALACQREHVERFRELGKPANVMYALANLSSVQHNLGRLTDARHSAREARELAERHQLPPPGSATDTLIRTYLDLGLLDEATTEAEALLIRATQAGNDYQRDNAHCALGDAALRRRRWRDALRHYRLVAESANAGWFVTSSVAGVGMALASSGLGRHDEALGHARQALATADRVACRLEEAGALTALAVAHHGRGDHDEAATHAERAVDILSASGARLRAARALDVLAVVRAAQGRTAAATAHRRAVRLTLDETGASESGSPSAMFGWDVRLDG